jgi:hypothetical protein
MREAHSNARERRRAAGATSCARQIMIPTILIFWKELSRDFGAGPSVFICDRSVDPLAHRFEETALS